MPKYEVAMAGNDGYRYIAVRPPLDVGQSSGIMATLGYPLLTESAVSYNHDNSQSAGATEFRFGPMSSDQLKAKAEMIVAKLGDAALISDHIPVVEGPDLFAAHTR